LSWQVKKSELKIEKTKSKSSKISVSKTQKSVEESLESEKKSSSIGPVSPNSSSPTKSNQSSQNTHSPQKSTPSQKISPKIKESMKEPVKLVTDNESISKSSTPINSSFQKPSNIVKYADETENTKQDLLNKFSSSWSFGFPWQVKESVEESLEIQAPKSTKPSTPKKVSQKTEKSGEETLEHQNKSSSKEPESSSQTSSNFEETNVEIDQNEQKDKSNTPSTTKTTSEKDILEPATVSQCLIMKPSEEKYTFDNSNAYIRVAVDCSHCRDISKVGVTTVFGEDELEVNTEMLDDGVNIGTSAHTGENGTKNPMDIFVKLEDDGRELDLTSSLDEVSEDVVATLYDIDHGVNTTRNMKIDMDPSACEGTFGEGSIHIDNPTI